MNLKALLLLLICFSFSVAYTQNLQEDLTLEERVAALEMGFATLDTRFVTRTTVGAGSLGTSNTGLAAQTEIDALQRQVQELNREIGNLRRQVDAATREATAARRDARNALSRIR